MRGRDRPISYEKARTLLFQHLAKAIGINVEFSSLDWHDGPIARNSDFSDDELGSLWAEAGHFLDQLIFAWSVPCWVEHDNQWKHADPDTLFARLSSGEEPNGLFVDRDDLETAAASTKEFSGFGATKGPSADGAASPETKDVKRRGRPPRSGALDDDASLRDMEELLNAGKVTSVNKAAEAVAQRLPPGHSYPSTVKRLCRKFMARQKGA